MRTPKHPCGCTSPQEELDPRHVIHFDSTKPLPEIDKEKQAAAEALLLEVRAEHAAAKTPEALEAVRARYKEAAIAHAVAGDATGAVLADLMDSIIDYDLILLEEAHEHAS